MKLTTAERARRLLQRKGRRHRPEPQPVKVCYVERDFGLSLQIDEQVTTAADDGGRSGPPADHHHGVDDLADGLLSVSDSCVTLELVGPKGRRSVLAWDPAEVAWDPLVSR